MKSEQGFTLLELIVTLAIFAILASIAVPSFNNILLKNKVQAETHTLRADISFARSEAASASKFITICASDDGNSCNASSDWSNGWIVFEDDGAGGSASDFSDIDKKHDEKLLRVTQQTRDLDIAATDSGGAGIQAIMFGPRGYVEGMRRPSTDTQPLKTTVRVCEPRGDNSVARGVWVDVTGRSAISHDADNNGVHEDASGVDLSC